MNYYQEKKEEISALINRQEKEKALSLIQEELSLAYLPADFSLWLTEKKEELLPEKQVEQAYFSLEKIRDFLKKDTEKQMIALWQLCERDLRKSLDLCQEYLSASTSSEEGKVWLIRELISQEIHHELKVTIAGVEYTFVPNYSLIPEESEGYQQAQKILEKEYFQNPSLFRFAMTLLYQKCLHHLPVYFDAEEADLLVEEVKKELKTIFSVNEGENVAIN